MDIVDGCDGEPVGVCASDDGYFLSVGDGVDLVDCCEEGALRVGLWGIGEGEKFEEDGSSFLEVLWEEELFEVGFNFSIDGPFLLEDADE